MPNKAPEPTIAAVTIRAPSSTARASGDRGSSLTFGKARMRVVIVVIAVVVGGWLTLDGTRALVKGDYVTASGGKLGPWARLVAGIGIDPRSVAMKCVHVALGVAWLLSAILFLSRVAIGWHVLFGCSILTLWYLPLGTLLSVVEILLLLLPALRVLK